MKRLCSIIIILSFISGCFLPRSTPYEPYSNRESQYYTSADKSVFPNDVRNQPENYREKLVAWAGILKELQIFEKEDHIVINLLIDHKYFDWIEDRRDPVEAYFLSPRGEGLFKCAWGLPKDTNLNNVDEGDMIVVYGYSYDVRDEVIYFHSTKYVRHIESIHYTTRRIDYGRPGEPVKALN